MKFWYSQNPLAWLLLPLSALFCLISFIRRKLYQTGILSTSRFNVPVVIVGNITAGGSGKTPLLISMCEWLKQQGKKPGVVSRGYGGRIKSVHQLSETDSPVDVGDEPLMIFQRTGCSVVVGADRPAAVNLLLATNDCDIVLSDDGLQHYRLGRAMEIAVVDTATRQGNGFCLPAGPLREPASRLKTVDLVVCNGSTPDIQESSDARPGYDLGFFTIVNLSSGEKRPLSELNNRDVFAVAGIGRPARFFDLLKEQGLTIETQSFADHYQFTEDDIRSWQGKTVLMTEKDAVKCKPLVSRLHQGEGYSSIWYLPVTAEWNQALKQAMVEKIDVLFDPGSQ